LWTERKEKVVRKITLTITAVLLVVAVLFVANSSLNKALAPDGIEPSVQVVDENHITRYSYIPHHSFIRSASTWYDRVVEEYTLEDGKFVLTSRIVYEYHYPIFGGKLSVHENILK